MALDPSGDHVIFDDTETVTLHQGTSSEDVDSVFVTQLSAEEAALAGLIAPEAKTRSFTLPEANLSGMIPQQGDKIVDAAGVAYTIVRLEYVRWVKQYVCYCSQQVGQ